MCGTFLNLGRDSMHNFSYNYEQYHKDNLNLYLSNQKETNKFKVLDVGGAVGPWFWDNTDVIFDIISPTTNYGKSFGGEYISGNATLPEGWKNLDNYIEKNGKFDFVICRQTLEDLSHPEFVVNKLQSISNAGWIGVPSKHFEMMKGIYASNLNTRGLHHHRWIYVSKNGRWYGLPKMGWTDSITDSSLKMKLNGSPWAHELSFYWEHNIDVFWLLPYCDNLPDDYGDEFIRDCLKGVEDPWDLWVNILNNSD